MVPVTEFVRHLARSDRQGNRILLHFLPRSTLETKPIERIWLRQHETIPRNHRCRSFVELVEQVDDWLDQQQTLDTPTLTNAPEAVGNCFYDEGLRF